MSSGLVYIGGKDFKYLSNKVGELSDDVLKAADNALANIGSEARPIIGAKAEKAFHLGQQQYKWKKGGYVSETFSVKDSKHGWYKSKTGSRIIGFSFENVAFTRKKGVQGLKQRINGVSTGRVYSLLNNLFYKDVTYRKNSPDFHGGWFPSDANGYYLKGETRDEVKSGMDESSIQEAVAPALDKTKAYINRLLAGWNR